METSNENFGAAHAIHSFITTAIIAQVAMMYWCNSSQHIDM